MKARFPLLLAALVPLLSFGADVPDNLGLGLKQLVETYQRDRTEFLAQVSSRRTVQADAADRVVVRIHLNGRKRLDEIRAALEGLGLEIIDVDLNWRGGVISAWLPISASNCRRDSGRCSERTARAAAEASSWFCHRREQRGRAS